MAEGQENGVGGLEGGQGTAFKKTTETGGYVSKGAGGAVLKIKMNLFAVGY